MVRIETIFTFESIESPAPGIAHELTCFCYCCYFCLVLYHIFFIKPYIPYSEVQATHQRKIRKSKTETFKKHASSDCVFHVLSLTLSLRIHSPVGKV